MRMEPERPAGLAARVLIVDDHPLVRTGLAQLIGDASGLEVCGEAATVDDALREVAAKRPDLALIDISLAGGNGLRLIGRIRDVCPQTRMLVVSMHDETTFAERALRAGAMGYVEKREASTRVIEAIRRVLAGRIYVSKALRERPGGKDLGGTGPDALPAIESLTNRELEVFELIGRGLSAREIAARLSRSVKTVETHREHIKHKLDLHSGSELTAHAIRWVLEQG
jgi:DNA-binding NarL/FixJ family response regulator